MPMPLSQVILLSIAIAAFAAGVSGQAVAGKLDQPEITDYRIWQSSRCYKPNPPDVEIADALTFNLAVEGFNQYLLHMRRYLECAEQEANEDYASLKRVLEQGLALVRSDALRDLQDVRENIDQYRPLYAPEPGSGEQPAGPPDQ